MKATLLSTMAAALLASAPLFAGELPFQAPSTQTALDRAPLLHRAAHALYEVSSARRGAAQISDLWLFPTADANTVFAEYRTTLSRSGALPTQHLVLLTLDADRLARAEELSGTHDDLGLNEARAPGLPWTAPSSQSYGMPGSSHWTALIGTGHVSGPETVAQNTSNESPRPTARPTWTAMIGTGDAAKSSDGRNAAARGNVPVAAQR